MRRVLFTQRVDVVESYNERRDCADQRIVEFLYCCGFIPVPLPNQYKIATAIFREVLDAGDLAGIVFTGGNSLVKYGGDAPERDDMERMIYDMALAQGIPVYGFCRGMQLILDCHGVLLEKVEGHVAVHHLVKGLRCNAERNSYHTLGCVSVNEEIEILARSEDGVIEAAKVIGKPVYATMWHPEREDPFLEDDIKCVKDLFNGGE